MIIDCAFQELVVYVLAQGNTIGIPNTLFTILKYKKASLVAQLIKNLLAMLETPVQKFPGEGIGYPLQYSWGSLLAQMEKNPPTI